jgi:hypothetical protein
MRSAQLCCSTSIQEGVVSLPTTYWWPPQPQDPDPPTAEFAITHAPTQQFPAVIPSRAGRHARADVRRLRWIAGFALAFVEVTGILAGYCAGRWGWP